MNNDAGNGATVKPITLDNEATLVAAVLAASSTIALDSHFLSSGLKLDTAYKEHG